MTDLPATYTAAEVKVLTEAALRLGRKEALDFAAAGIQREIDEFSDGEPQEYLEGLRRGRRVAIDSISFLPSVPSQPSGAVSDERSGVAEGPRLSEDRERLIAVLEAEWLKHAEAKTVDSPRGHCERLADAIIAEQQEVSEGRRLDLDRLIAIKWGDKVIDPTEVAYVLRDLTKGNTP